jgi:hypothetical protein
MTLVRRSHILALAAAALLPAGCADVPLDDSAPYDDEPELGSEQAALRDVEASCASGSCSGMRAKQSSPCAVGLARLPCPPPEDEARPSDSPCSSDSALPCPPPEDALKPPPCRADALPCPPPEDGE